MRTKRFQAATMADAQQLVREALGDDAIILSTRTAQTSGRLGLGRKQVIEVTAALPDEPRPALRAPSTAATATAEPPEEEQPLAPPFINVLAGAGRGGPFDVYNRVAQINDDAALDAALEAAAEPAAAPQAPPEHRLPIGQVNGAADVLDAMRRARAAAGKTAAQQSAAQQRMAQQGAAQQGGGANRISKPSNGRAAGSGVANGAGNGLANGAATAAKNGATRIPQPPALEETAAEEAQLDAAFVDDVPIVPKRRASSNGAGAEKRARTSKAATAATTAETPETPAAAKPASTRAKSATTDNEAAQARAARTRAANAAAKQAAEEQRKADQALLASLTAELAQMRSTVEHLTLERAAGQPEAGPPLLQQTRAHLLAQELDETLVQQVLQLSVQGIDGKLTPKALQQAIRSRLLGQLPPAAPIRLDRLPTTIFVVGPGGAGKTTLAVRLGIDLQRTQGLRVLIAGTDVDRAGAPQQLEAYGAAASIPVKICYTPSELQALVAGNEADVVIVDTAGHTGADRERMAELEELTDAAPVRQVLLALPATTKSSDLVRITSAFAAKHIDGLVLTRCDETASYGGVLNAAVRSKIGVAASTHGEASTEPARPADNEALVAAIVQGRWPEPRGGARRGRAG